MHYVDKPLSAEDNAKRLEARTLRDPPLTEFLRRNHVLTVGQGLPQKWNAAALEMAGLYFNPSLEIARSQLAAAEAVRITAAAVPNPMVNLSPTYDATTPPPWILGLSFDVPIETAGKRGIREEEAKHLSDASLADLTQAIWDVRSRIRSAFLSLYLAQEKHPLLVEQEAAESESTRIFEEELRIGEISPFEATQSEVALNQVRFALRDNQAEIADARAHLAATIGISPAALDGVQFDFSEFEGYPPNVLDSKVRDYALLSRMDIRAGLATYSASQSVLQLEIAKQYPDIHLGPGYLRDQGPDNIPGQYDNKWTLAVSISLPIFNQNEGPIAEAEARRRQAAASFDALQTKVLADVDQALTNYRAATDKARAAETLQSNLAEQVRVADGMLKVGEISPVELAQRKLELTAASLSQLDAMGETQSTFGTLQDTLQSPEAVAAVVVPSSSTGRGESREQVIKQVAAVALPNVKGDFDLMAADVSGKRLFLDAEGNNTTEIINISSNSLIREIGGMQQPKWVVYRPELNRLYVANGNGDVRVLDATTYKFLRAIHFREKANNLHFDPLTGELFVGVGNTFGAIGIVDTKSDRIIQRIPLAGSPNQFELDGNFIYVNVPSANHIAVIDRRKDTVIATWPLAAAKGNYPMGIDRAHHRLFIGLKPGKLDIIDTSAGKEISTVDISSDADGVYYDDTRHKIYVSCGSGWLYVIGQSDPDHYSVINRIATAEGAGTSLFVPALDRLFLPIPQRGTHPAELRTYSVAAP